MNKFLIKIKRMFCNHWFEFVKKDMGRNIFKCNKCGTIYIFESGGKRYIVDYVDMNK